MSEKAVTKFPARTAETPPALPVSSDFVKPMSPAMISRAQVLNIRAKMAQEILLEVQEKTKKTVEELNDYLAYCRAELNAPAEQYELKSLEIGFTMFPQLQEKFKVPEPTEPSEPEVV